MGRVTDVAPAGLVPAAWLVTAGAHQGAVSERTLLIALVVMDILLAAFILAGASEMTGPVLEVWRLVLFAGLPLTLAGTVGLWLSPPNEALLGVSLYGWMLLPGAAYLRTGNLVTDTPFRQVYFLAGALSMAGAVLYAAASANGMGVDPEWLLVGLASVGVGQSAGMVAAAVQNS
jgi:hypothetical protein